MVTEWIFPALFHDGIEINLIKLYGLSLIQYRLINFAL